MIALAAFTMTRTRSGTDRASWRRIWEISTPRSSSTTGRSMGEAMRRMLRRPLPP